VLAYSARRVLQALVVVLFLTLLTFTFFHMLPGGPARAIIGRRATPRQIAIFDRENGLDEPIIVQYLTYLNHLIHGNLGYSYKDNESVNSILAQDIPKSLILIGSSTLIALVIGLVTGLFQAVRRNSIEDHVLTGGAFFLYAMPDFFLALILIDIFAIRLHVFPTEGPQGSWTSAFTDPQAMVLPVATLSLTSIAIFSRYMRSSALDVFGQDFIRVARAKGASTGHLLRWHTLRNSCIPIITLLGLSLPGLFTGAIIIEEVFNYPGLGLETFKSAVDRDYAVTLAITVIVGFTTIIGNLIADLSYAWLDPRVRLQ